MIGKILIAACASALSVAGCRAGLPPEPAAPTRSAAGLDIVSLSIASGGRSHRFRVEVAHTPEQQSRGMMYRDRLAPDRGMIFDFAEPRPASFWMKNTPNSLDLIFIASDGRIESIAADAVPFSLDHLTSIGTVAAVLEIAGGRAAELGLAPGDRVSWERSQGR